MQQMKSQQAILRFLALAGLLSSVLLLASRVRAEEHALPRTTNQGDFFIISSVDVSKKRIVLKRPTEVTELILVTEKTVYRDEQDKPIEFRDLRAGDTVYVTATRGPDGVRVATRIRQGPMTVEELHRRYVPFQ